MKKNFLKLIIAITVITGFSSCYVEEREGHRYHRPFYRHRETVIIRSDNTVNPANVSPIRPHYKNLLQD